VLSPGKQEPCQARGRGAHGLGARIVELAACGVGRARRAHVVYAVWFLHTAYLKSLTAAMMACKLLR
jgi:hypothetical protein